MADREAAEQQIVLEFVRRHIDRLVEWGLNFDAPPRFLCAVPVDNLFDVVLVNFYKVDLIAEETVLLMFTKSGGFQVNIEMHRTVLQNPNYAQLYFRAIVKDYYGTVSQYSYQ